MTTRTDKLYSPAGLFALLVLGLAVLFLSSVLLKSWRIDLTEGGLFSVSAGTRNVLADIDEPINLYYFFSDTAAAEATQLRDYAKRVRELLEEFALEANGKINLQVIDPLPFSEEEDQAAQFGVQAVPLRGGDSVYFGLAGTNALDDQAAIPFFQVDKEAFLEYDLAKLIYSLAHPQRPVIGLLSTLPMSGGFEPTTMQSTPAWMITEQLGQLFDVRTLDVAVSEIADDIDVLMLVHPKALSDDTLYAIDQFVLGGGRALIFVDPFAEVDLPPRDPNNMAAMFNASRTSDLATLFRAWGVEFSAGQFVGDDVFALTVGDASGQRQVRHIGLLGFDAAALAGDDVVTGELGILNMGYAGAFESLPDAPATLLPLISSSGEAALLDAAQLKFMPDPNALRDGFAPDGKAHVVAARLQGTVPTAYPDGGANGKRDGHLDEAREDINVIVVGDVDVLSDRLWVQVQNFFGQRLASAFANNGDFVFNALDNLTGNSDLISIRGRASFQRPFDRVEEIRRRADEAYRATEERLQQELEQTEQRLGELQSSREDSNTLIMTPEQQAEIEQFLEQKVRIRKELRQVRRNLDRDIEQLGYKLKALNVLAVPLLVVVFALWMGRRRQQRAVRQRSQ